MDALADQNLKKYRNTLSSNQRRILLAVEKETLGKVSLLFNAQSESSIQENQLDYVLLTTALKRKHKSIARFLLKSGCRPNSVVKTNFHNVPLYYAFQQNDSRIADDLIRKGASIYDTDVNKKTPLDFVVQEINNHEMIDIILGNLKTIRSPSEWNPHDKQDIALFHLACLRSDRTAIENFLDEGFSVNSRSNFDKEEWEGFTPLHFMVTGYESWSTDSLAERLLKKDYDFFAQDKKGRTALHLAFRLICKKPVWSLSDSRLAQNWIHNITDREFNNPTDENGLSLFHIICCGISDDLPKHLKCVQFFIDNGVDINSSVSSKDEIFPGYTAMHFAVKNLEFDTIKLLIDNGANLYETNEEGLTPLHIACDCLTLCSPLYDSDPLSDKRLKRMRIVELFLKCGTDVNAEDGKGGTYLHHAFNSNRGEDEPLMQLLLSKSQMSKNYTDSNGVSYLHIASSMNVSAVENLMKNGALPLSHLNEDAPFEPGYFPLHFSVLFNKVEIVQYLLENGVNPNIKTVSEIKATPLHIACTYDESELYIFKNSVIYDNFEATLQSYQNDKVRIVELLLKHGASINEKDSFGVTPLSKACLIPKSPYFSYYKKEQEIMQQLYTGQLEMVQLLLCRGADPTLRSNDGRSILHDLVYQKPSCQRHTLAEIVVNSGADLNALDNDGFAPLHVAVKDSRVAASNATLIKLFCENGANINGKSKNDFTPLHFAVIHDKFDSMKILAYILDHDDVDLNSQNIYGDTPLHTAIKLKIHLHIEKLLNAGADIQIKNIEGILPSDLLCGWMWEKSQDSRENISKTLILAIRHFKRLLKMNTFVTKKVREDFDLLMKPYPVESVIVDDTIEAELNMLKSIMLDHFTSLREILFKDANDMVKHVKNEELKKIIASPNLKSDFPLFHNVLIQKFKTGSKRSLFFEPAKAALGIILQVNWPDSCSEQILKYLCNENLKNLIESCSCESSRKRSRESSSSQDECQPKNRKLD